MTSRRSASLNFRVMISPVYFPALSERTLGWYLCSCSWAALPFFPLSVLAGTTAALAFTSALGTSSGFWTVTVGGGGGVAGFCGVVTLAAVSMGFCSLKNETTIP